MSAMTTPTTASASGPLPVPLARPILGPLEQEAVARVLASGHLAQGAEVAAFEEEFSAHVDDRHCIAVASGTAALHLGLLAAGIGPGDEVIVPAFTFAATANAVRLAGAHPVFADIDPVTYCLDPEAVAAAITPRTTAIMPVHLYGHPADMASLGALAARHGLLLFEDAAQAHLATTDGRPAGALGAMAAFSFYATKNMTTGEGGMIVTADDETARRARVLRNQGMTNRYEHELVGFNERLTDLAAAIGRVQLQRLPEWTAARRRHAARLDAELRGVECPTVVGDVTHVYHQYVVRHPDRDALAAHLAAHGIGTAVHYPTPVSAQPAYGDHIDWVGLELPATERACREVLSLPVRPDLTAHELDRIIEAVATAPDGTASAGAAPAAEAAR